jgi:hypothetical protein
MKSWYENTGGKGQNLEAKEVLRLRLQATDTDNFLLGTQNAA